MEKVMIIDGNSIMNRAFYGLQGSQLLATTDGLYTNAVFGFLNILYKYLEEEKPEYLCVAFDLKAPTFRHKEFDSYKANRKGMPPELAVQMPVIKDVLDAMNIKRLEYEGFEADDILGSVSLCAEKAGMGVIIITGDRDSLQLATETTRIKIPTTRGGKTETDEYNSEKVMEKYGVTPTQFIDVKGLMGDSSDNIPGVPGIGEKTAISLIQQFSSMEDIYENLDNVQKKGVREKLEANKELAFQSKWLATIVRNIDNVCSLDDLKRRNFNNEKLLELFKRLEFRSFIDKFKLHPTELTAIESVEATMNKVACIREIEHLKEVKELMTEAGGFSILCLIDRYEVFSTKLVGLAFSWAPEQAVYIQFNECLSEADFFYEFKTVFENEKIKKYGHDLKGLLVYLKNKDIEMKGVAFDTMIAAYLVNPSRETYTIAELSEEYVKKTIEPLESLVGKGKTFTPFSKIDIDKLSGVAAVHVEKIGAIKAVLEKILEENSQTDLYYDIELPLVEVLAGMEYWGFKVHPDELRSFSGELEEKIKVIEKEIYELAGEEFNINSPKQLGVILFEKLELPVIKKTKTGYSTDAEVLEQLSAQNEVVSKIIEYRQLMKLKSTYAEGLLAVVNPVTGKIHSSFNQTVTTTGRISSTEPNLQNIPIKLEMGRKIRKVFVPTDENFLLSDADYSQIELRVLAHITSDENMINAFKNNEDIHTTTASRIFGVPKEQVTSSMRTGAKAVNFGIVYGIGEFSLSKDLGISRKEARKYIDEYLNKYPGVRQYMHEVVELGKEKGYVSTMFHRRRYLPELKSSNFNLRSFGERIAMNTPIQGSAADIIKIAMVKVYKTLLEKKLKSRLILQVHDELIIETHKEETEQVETILKECMESAVELQVPLLAEVKTGSNWYETK